MKKIQGNPWGKLLAVALLLAAAFGAGQFAIKGLLNLPYVLADDWQSTTRFYDLLVERQDQLAQMCSLDMELAGELPFAQQQQKLQSLTQLQNEPPGFAGRFLTLTDKTFSTPTWTRWDCARR